MNPEINADPDRFFGFEEPGSQEWWYFDAISRDGRDALVLVWYVGLPFDPRYGLAAINALKDPKALDRARPMDHCAIGISWYRDGKMKAYALNAYPAERVAIQGAPFRVEIGPTRLQRDEGIYRLTMDTPHVDGKTPIRADLEFAPTARNRPFETVLGPHSWLLAAADCGVKGTVNLGAETLEFEGRGYHDHNAGAEELSLSWKRWRWGRVHFGPYTQVYYIAEPRTGETTSTVLLLKDGRAVASRRPAEFRLEGWKRTGLGIKYASTLGYQGDSEPDAPLPFRRTHAHTVDAGPFYLRWLSEFEVEGHGKALGFSELLEGDRLHRPLFNWMIPYRLKKPS